ncbi:hypothetical protein Hanom_Chr15g01409081 [Helianthus anomalus]
MQHYGVAHVSGFLLLFFLICIVELLTYIVLLFAQIANSILNATELDRAVVALTMAA